MLRITKHWPRRGSDVLAVGVSPEKMSAYLSPLRSQLCTASTFGSLKKRLAKSSASRKA
mgnify:CR=1 FL=1